MVRQNFNNRRRRARRLRPPVGFLVFWFVFFSGATVLFVTNRHTISRNFNLLMERVSGSPDTQGGTLERAEEAAPLFIIVPDPRAPSLADFAEPADLPAQPWGQASPDAFAGGTAVDTAGSPGVTMLAPMQEPQAAAPAWERHIYFTQVSNEGQVFRARVSRVIEASDSPLRDALHALLAGPSAEELDSGIISLIPHGAQLVDVFVQGQTAYIVFNDSFQFNPFGVEGVAAQVQQVVWTATEFPTVSDVQILIEGRRVDFIGEGIWIGSPINRQAL